MIDKNSIPTKLFWVDLEMTGLDPETDVIVEVAAIVTDFEFKTLATFESVIKQPDSKLAAMNDWAKQHFTESGLLEKIRDGRDEKEVVAELASFMQENFNGEPAILAGNSIYQDRRFIRQWWPEIDGLLHYRMLDVSSLKILMQGKYGVEYEKKEAHRATSDIEESIAELQHYLEWLTKRGSQAE